MGEYTNMNTNTNNTIKKSDMYDFNTWLEAEHYTSYEEYNHMSKQERSYLRNQYDSYVKSIAS